MQCYVPKSELEERRTRVLNLLLAKRTTLLTENFEKVNGKIYWEYKVPQAEEILKSAYQIFGNSLVVAFSGGKDSLVALHLTLHAIDPRIAVLYNNTTVEFPDTINYVQKLAKEWNLNLKITSPKEPFFTATKKKGWASHENRWCCRPYKEDPAFEFMQKKGIVAEITGTTRTESIYRRSLTPIKMPKKQPSIIRVNPIYDWNQWEVWRYIESKGLPYNPLYDKGYRRIGCWCCPLNGFSHYRRLRKTHEKLHNFLQRFKPLHPYFETKT